MNDTEKHHAAEVRMGNSPTGFAASAWTLPSVRASVAAISAVPVPFSPSCLSQTQWTCSELGAADAHLSAGGGGVGGGRGCYREGDAVQSSAGTNLWEEVEGRKVRESQGRCTVHWGGGATFFNFRPFSRVFLY